MILEKLYPYQADAVKWVLDRFEESEDHGAALFCEQGTGKTYITAGVLESLVALGPVHALVVVPLANVETTWARTLGQIPDLEIHREWGPFRESSAAHRVLLVHYEALAGIGRKALKFPWSLVAYDESQRLKARASRASRFAARFHDAHRRLVLSGTPIEQCPQDLWAQFRFALPSVLGTTWSTFDERWLKPTGYMGYKRKFRQERMPAFLRLIEPHIRRVTKREVLDLPPLRYIRSTVQMYGDQARVYREVSEDLVAEVDGGTVTCAMEITRLIRQQQVVGGFVRLDPTPRQLERAAREAQRRRRARKPKGRLVYLGGAKARRLRRILAREELPVVVFCKYSEEISAIERACAHLRVGVVRGKTRKTRTATVDAFQRGELDVLICQIRAGGVGLDLFRACVGIFYSCTFSSIDFEQAVCRLHRNGQTREVRIYLIQASNTVDKDIWSGLLLKKSVTRLILDRRRHHG